MFNTRSKTLKQLANQGKRVSMPLIGEDGNAFAIMARFQRSAKMEGWSEEEIDAVLSEAQSSDYNHLLTTVLRFTEVE